MDRRNRYSLILLAGGRSRRMGSDKAQLVYRGKTFVDNFIEKAEALGIEKIYLSGAIYESRKSMEPVGDIYPARGPLGGIHACLMAMKTPYALVLPVDVPQLPVEALEKLLQFHEQQEVQKQELRKLPYLLCHGGRKENLMGIYPAEMAEFIEPRIREKSASVHGMLEDYGAVWVPAKVPEWTLENINDREAYEKLLQTAFCHDFKRGRKMLEKITLEEAVDLIRSHVRKCERTEERLVKDASGFLLAEDLYAGIDNPPFPRSPVDGYAVRSEDLQGADKDHPVYLKVVGCIYAGEDGQSREIRPGEAMRIMTGAPFPKGSDTAVRQEDTDYGEELAGIFREQKAYENYCLQGEDYKADSCLLKKGDRITFAEQGILSSVGRKTVRVFCKPRVRVITTGDEVCAPGEGLLPGKIYDSNGMLVSARLRELGIEPGEVLHVADSEEVLAKALQKACEDAEVIITTGGVSVGKKDILHGALEKCGAEKIFWRVQIQPGTPSIFSVCENTLILSLSGNPFGAVANLELLARPLLFAMTGDESYVMERREGILMEEFSKKSKGRRFVRAIYRDGEVRLPEGIRSSGAIATLRGCNCLLDIPAGSDALKAGERVCVWML